MRENLTFDDVQIKPKYSEIESRSSCKLDTYFTQNYRIPSPIVSAPMDTVTEFDMAFRLGQLGGVGIIHRFLERREQANQIAELDKNFIHGNISIPTCAAIGATTDYKDRAKMLVDEGCNVLLIDVAHGDHILVQRAIEHLKINYEHVDVIAGNVATFNGAYNLCRWGADAIRVGIGNGSLCTTRIKTGVGVPQISALQNAKRGVDEFVSSQPDIHRVPIIADGGLRTPGDIAKALATGADTVMVGSLFAGTRESPGPIQRSGVWPNESLYKKYRGSASADSKQARGEDSKNVEGQSTVIPYKGKVKRIFNDICDGIRSSMSYVNAQTIEEFHNQAELIRVTNAGQIEAKPHLIE